MKKIPLFLATVGFLGLQSCELNLPTFSSVESLYTNKSTVVNKKGTMILAKAQAKRFKVDYPLLLGVIHQESAFNVTAVSRAGAQGLMQIMPGTVKHINQSSPIHISSPFNPAQNIAGGTWYLRLLYNNFEAWPASERIKLALASYNGGIGRVFQALNQVQKETNLPLRSIGWQDIAARLPAETREYVPSVLSYRRLYQSQLHQGNLPN